MLDISFQIKNSTKQSLFLARKLWFFISPSPVFLSSPVFVVFFYDKIWNEKTSLTKIRSETFFCGAKQMCFFLLYNLISRRLLEKLKYFY